MVIDLKAEYLNSFKELRQAFRIQVRVVHALILREIRTRFWKNRLGYIWATAEPCIHLAVWYFIIVEIRHRVASPGTNLLLFVCSGIIPLFLFTRVSNFVTGAIVSNSALLQYPLVKNLDVIFARFILEASTMIVVALVVFGSLISFEWIAPPRDLLGLFAPCAALLLLALGLGTFNAVATILSPTYGEIFGFFRRIIYITSGIFFLGNNLPASLLQWAIWNPIFHGIELFRTAYFYGYETEYGSISYILGLAGGFFLLGLMMERAFRNKLIER